MSTWWTWTEPGTGCARTARWSGRWQSSPACGWSWAAASAAWRIWKRSSAAVEDPAFVREAVSRYGERIAVGVDTKDGKVRTAGWVQDSGLDYLDFVKEMESIGVKTIIFTDIDTDGALSGPSFARLEALRQNYSGQIVASGGVSSNEDLRALSRQGLYGAIIGKAWYTGAVDLAQAVREEGAQC